MILRWAALFNRILIISFSSFHLVLVAMYYSDFFPFQIVFKLLFLNKNASFNGNGAIFNT